MKTTPLPLILLLSLLLLAPTAKAEGQDKTNWQDENVLANVSVGTDDSSTDVQVTITNNDTLYTIKTALGLAWIARITNTGSVYKESSTDNQFNPHQKGFKNCTVELSTSLTNDTIDLSGYYWTPIGNSSPIPFYGTFNGNHKVVTGLKIDIDDTSNNIYAGLFGCLQGDVRDLGIQVAAAGIKVKGKGVTAGTLAGYNKGTIQNCFAIGESNAVIDVESTLGEKLGGLIGENSGGNIMNCYATLDIQGTLNGYTANIGGLVGYIDGESNISHVYATGKIKATGQSFSQMGGVVGYIDNSTLSHALAANNEITATNTTTSDFLGRICGYVYAYNTHCDTATCYASTKIRMNYKVTGVGEDSNGKYLDGINADTDTDLGELFPTGDDAVWEYSSSNTGNLPILKGFNSNLQGTTAKADVFDSPLDLADLTANSGTTPTNETQTFVTDSLIFSNTEGWIHKQGTDGQKAAFSGRVKGTGTGVQLAIKTDTAAVLSFKDGTELTGPSVDYASAIRICKSQTEGKATYVTLRSEGTVTVKGSESSNQYALSLESCTCHFDPKNRFLFYGNINNISSGLRDIISWKWDSAPKSNITVNWDGGYVTIPCGNENSYIKFATNPGGDNITVRVGKDFQKGQLGDKTGNFVSTFNFVNSETRVSTSYYDMTSAGDKGTADNPYVIDLAALSTNANAADSGYTYTDTDDRKIVTLGCANSMTEAYYSIENKAANNAHILLTSADGLTTPLSLKARSGSFVDSLQVPAEADWTLKGDTLKASYVEVSGGLKLDGPVTVENTVMTGNNNYALKVLAGGSVTAGDVLKAYITGTGSTAIYTNYEGTFTIDSEGKVYAYGQGQGYYGNISINPGGILRSAGSSTASTITNVPVIVWKFTHKPKTELVAKHENEEIRFTREMFGKYLDEAHLFAAYVTADAEYKLYQEGKGEPLIGTSLSSNDGRDIVEVFSTTAGRATNYENVGNKAPDPSGDITITESKKYTDSSGEHEYNNILVNTRVSLLKVGKTNGNSFNIAVSGIKADSLVVEGWITLSLNHDNTLDSIAVAEGGSLSFSGASNTGTLTCSKGVINRGTFKDRTGLITSATVPLTGGDVIITPKISGNAEVPAGSTTVLTATASLASEGTSPSPTLAYTWYEWKNDHWGELNDGIDNTNSSYSLGAGKYRCMVTVTLRDVMFKSTGPTVTTLLTSFFTVTEKSTPPAPPVVIPTYYTVTLPAVEGATFSRATGETTVEEGTNFTFSITLDADYDQSVPVVTTDRGETIEPRAGDGRYVVRDIREDVVITVTGIRRNDDPTANAAVTPDAVRLWTASGQLHISTPVAADLRIYTFDGSLLRSLRLPAGETVMEAPAGPCIVVVGDQRFKVAR